MTFLIIVIISDIFSISILLTNGVFGIAFSGQDATFLSFLLLFPTFLYLLSGFFDSLLKRPLRELFDKFFDLWSDSL